MGDQINFGTGNYLTAHFAPKILSLLKIRVYGIKKPLQQMCCLNNHSEIPQLRILEKKPGDKCLVEPKQLFLVIQLNL